jgi:hypothetical protein
MREESLAASGFATSIEHTYDTVHCAAARGPTGYLHPDYAASFGEFGMPRQLPCCGGWIIEREIPGVPDRDAMGCYPLFACQDWTQLAADFRDIGQDLVSLVLISDPFGGYSEADLRHDFDLVIPFKEHLVADLRRPINEIVSRDHRKCARMAHNKGVHVEECTTPSDHIDDWMILFETLRERHDISGIRSFSRTAFVKQFSIPGLIMLRAVHLDTTVGIGLFMVHDDVAYAHLVAYSQAAYHLRVSCKLYWAALELLANKVRWIDWGGNAGAYNDLTDGLSQFKRGWSTGTRTAYLCGKVINQERYTALMTARALPNTDYFPAYRSGEMG